jgi:hypothetical protein
MKITILVEGSTEMAFKPHLMAFLKNRLRQSIPKLDFFPCEGRIYKGDKLRRTVQASLSGKQSADAVIALTDVYTGSQDFDTAADAKQKMRQWVGPNPAFYPHAAQYDFEAWLLPYWSTIQQIAGHNRTAPSGAPEFVNHNHPPSHYIEEIFRLGKQRAYSKRRDASRILTGKDLGIAAAACPELRAFLNTILTLSGGEPL